MDNDDELTDAEHERHSLTGGHGVQLTPLTDSRLNEMRAMLESRFGDDIPSPTQQADALASAGCTDQEIDWFLEETT